MGQQRVFFIYLFTSILLIFPVATVSAADNANAKYSWMLPKTVIDVQIVYTFKKCGPVDPSKPEKGVTLSFDVAPTLTPRAAPDLAVGRLEINVNDLKAFSQDKNIAITTSAGSHILSSIGSSPTDQTTAIIGNILGGVSKLAGIALGAPVAIAGADAPKAPACSDDPKSPNVIVSQIKDYTKAIDGLEIQISQLKDDQGKPLNEVNLKELAAQIQALQTMVTEAQKKITLTVKGTIDPGSGFLPDTATHPNAAGSIPKTGLIAGIAPTAEELLQKKWFKGAAPDPKTSPLLVNVYLDFEQALLYMATENPPPWKGASPYQQTKLTKAQQDTTMDLYRDVAYIPLLVWKGDRENDKKGDRENDKCKELMPPPVDDDDTPVPTCPKQLTAPKTIPFAQYGIAQKLPTTADFLQSLSWAVSFTEFGEITNATFSTKAWGINATSIFGSASTAASSIASEQAKATSANSPTAQAAAIQSQADLIYEGQRLALCQAHPASCSSK